MEQNHYLFKYQVISNSCSVRSKMSKEWNENRRFLKDSPTYRSNHPQIPSGINSCNGPSMYSNDFIEKPKKNADVIYNRKSLNASWLEIRHTTHFSM